MAQYNKRTGITHDDAETLAIEALTFLAAEETRLASFVKATGLDLAAIRSQASSPEFLAGVIDFLMSDESLLLVFVTHSGIDPNLVALARRALMPSKGDDY